MLVLVSDRFIVFWSFLWSKQIHISDTHKLHFPHPNILKCLDYKINPIPRSQLNVIKSNISNQIIQVTSIRYVRDCI